MSLLELAAPVCRVFTNVGAHESRTVQKIKNQQSRDVVTSLDEQLHNVTVDYLARHPGDCQLLSEEGQQVPGTDVLKTGAWLVVDPLDGSNNYALSLPGYGYMAARLDDGVITGSLVVLPEHDLYLIAEGGAIRTSQAFALEGPAPSSPVYYAYPPRLDPAARQARQQLLECIDARSSGIYRSGSACLGLFNLWRGKHLAFIGQHIRVWDALAWFPLLAHHQVAVRYRLTRDSLTFVASADPGFMDEACEILRRAEGAALVPYSVATALVIA